VPLQHIKQNKNIQVEIRTENNSYQYNNKLFSQLMARMPENKSRSCPASVAGRCPIKGWKE
jgi:hypothetical protein